MQGIRIVKARVDDAALLATLSISTFCETFADTNSKEDMDKYVADELNIDQITNELNDNDNEFYIAYMATGAAGYAKIRTSKIPENLDATRPMEIERLYVLQVYQGQNIGAALMNHCVTIGRARQHDVVWLGVWEHNQKAIDFYKKWGFVFFGSHIFKLGSDEQTDMLMRLEL